MDNCGLLHEGKCKHVGRCILCYKSNNGQTKLWSVPVNADSSYHFHIWYRTKTRDEYVRFDFSDTNWNTKQSGDQNNAIRRYWPLPDNCTPLWQSQYLDTTPPDPGRCRLSYPSSRRSKMRVILSALIFWLKTLPTLEMENGNSLPTVTRTEACISPYSKLSCIVG